MTEAPAVAKKPRKKRANSVKTILEDRLINQIIDAGLPLPAREFRFHPKRLWRFDLVWKSLRLAVEVNGAIYTGGRHSRGAGLEGDYEKINEAQILGWQVFQFSGGQIRRGEAVEMIKRALAARKGSGKW
jgi:hypothetical protein